MSEFNLKTRLLMSSMIAGAMFVATATIPAMAQEDETPVTTTDEAAPDAEARQQRITVTGTRILQPNLTTTSPVSSVSSEDFKLQGVTRVEDLVTQLPQAFAAQNSTVSNGASGTATVSLRNLGATRTLVLIDGKRMPYGSPNDPAADLNLIPSQLVERVDVLTGGASAVYGSDAISGVVNFIMKKDFEGVQVDAQYGFFNHENDYDTNGNLRDVIEGRAATNPSQFALPEDNVTVGYSKEITGVIGMQTDDGRGGFVGYVGYRNNDSVLQKSFDYSSCAIGSANATGFTCGGSGTADPARFTDFATFDLTFDRDSGAYRPWSNATDQYNYGPLNFYQRPDERYSAGFFADYEVNPYVNAYANFMFMDYQSNSQIAPSGNFFSTASINCDNPLLPAAITAVNGCTPAAIAAGDSVTMYIGRRNTEGGGRQDNLGYQTYRGVIGFNGPLFDVPGFEYDVSAQFSQVTLTRSYGNEFSTARLTRGLDVITDPDTGLPACRSAVDGSDPNCVPYNPFVQGGIGPDFLDYVQLPLLQNGTTEQSVVIASITGDLGQYGFQLPTADEGLKVAGGLEYRRDAISQTVDVSFSSGDGAGQGGPTLPLSGSIDVYDLFGEFQLPLITGRPGVELLSLDGAARVSDYSTGISSEAWKIGAEYAPTSDVRFRGSYQKAVRAPNVIDLFTSQGLGLFDIDDDPCDFTDPAGDGTATAAACIGGAPHQLTLTQANAGFVTSPAGQYNQLTGGNPDLDPEEATTFTVGFVATPSFVPGLSLSVDYYDIEITEAISSVGSSVTTQLCYFEGDADACGRITRNPGTGAFWTPGGVIQDLNLNIGGIQTSGVDISGAYGFDIGQLGGINLTYNGTYLDSYTVDPINQPFAEFDCVGKYGNDCGTPTPEYRHRARLGWATPYDGLGLNLTWRHIGAVDLDTGATGRVDSTLDAQDYFDVSGTWAVRDWAAFRFGVNNFLDNDPPLSASVGTTGNGNTYPQTYDAMGRYVFLGLTVDF
ncbi:TonB-dependent receptor [Hyphomonas sp.]|uniref:TonB-dependent receptor domain-containing protein n=1 Tax=Hyphomonas sp. TaxID=87 RepID=UPI00261AC8A6|nr:TonB-dependent receptor [Hyphomonas sp.]